MMAMTIVIMMIVMMMTRRMDGGESLSSLVLVSDVSLLKIFIHAELNDFTC